MIARGLSEKPALSRVSFRESTLSWFGGERARTEPVSSPGSPSGITTTHKQRSTNMLHNDPNSPEAAMRAAKSTQQTSIRASRPQSANSSLEPTAPRPTPSDEPRVRPLGHTQPEDQPGQPSAPRSASAPRPPPPSNPVPSKTPTPTPEPMPTAPRPGAHPHYTEPETFVDLFWPE